MKTFKEFINEELNEGLRDKMVGKSDNEILKSLEKLSNSDKIIAIIKYQLDYSLLPITLDSNGVPDNLIVKGDLYCSNNQLIRLPDNLVVKGGLNCSYNQLTKLPDNLVVEGDLKCWNNQLTKLPDNLVVEGDLWCRNNKIELPKNAKIEGGFYN